jgi:hypothetical protein
LNTNGNCAGFRADIKADPASGTPGSFVGSRIITLTIQGFALNQDFLRTRHNAKRTTFAEMNSDYNIASIRITHNILQNVDCPYKK